MADFSRVLASTMIVSFTIMLAFTIGGNIRVAGVPRAAMQMITVLLANVQHLVESASSGTI